MSSYLTAPPNFNQLSPRKKKVKPILLTIDNQSMEEEAILLYFNHNAIINLPEKVEALLQSRKLDYKKIGSCFKIENKGEDYFLYPASQDLSCWKEGTCFETKGIINILEQLRRF